MSYTKITDYAAKDNLLTGNPNKVIKGTELGAEFDAIVTADALNLKRDGSATVSANLPMNSKKLTGLAAGSTAGDSVRYEQVGDLAVPSFQAGTGVYVATVGGTADAITLTPSPAITAYAAGQFFSWIASGANTGATTLAVSGLVAKAVTKNGTTALIAGDIPSGALVGARYDGTQFQLTAVVADRLPKAGGTMTGDIVLTAPAALEEGRSSVAMHATTMDLWALANVIDGTGSAVTVTAIANAPQAGARRTLYPVANSIITNGATFAVDGAANHTAASGDKWEFEAITTSTYKVHVTKASGTAAPGANSDITSLAAVTALTNATGVDIKGTNTNDSAAAGYVGEFVSGVVASGSAVALTSALGANVTSISLTAGDWDVSGNIIFIPAATTSITALFASSSSTSATHAADYYRFDDQRAAYVPAGGQRIGSTIPTQRFSLSGTTTIYLVAQANFTVSTLSAYGFISARRVR